MPRDQPPDARQEVLEVPEVKSADAGNPGDAEFQDGQAAAWPHHPCHLGAGMVRTFDIPDTERYRHGVYGPAAHRQLRCIALHKRDASALAGFTHFPAAERQHGAREVHANDACRALRLKREQDRALLGFGPDWAASHPRTLHLLQEEAEAWARQGGLRLMLPR